MAKLYHLARMTTPTTGNGGTLTLGTAIAGYLSFSAAGVQNGDNVSYAIVDGSQIEIGRGTYNIFGPTLTRSVIQSSNNNLPLTLSGNAEVYISEISGTGSVATGSGLVPSEEGPGIDLVGTQIGLGGDSILIYHPNGNPVSEFAANSGGLSAALAAASDGDVVMLPAGEISGDQTVPIGVSLVGMGRDASILSGKITLTDGANLSNLKLAVSGNDDTNAIIGVLAPVIGEAHLYDCSVAPINAGLGGVHAVEINSGGDLYCHDCFLDGKGVIEGATGYAGFRSPAGSGSLYIDGGVCLGSDPDNPFND
jgi:hypothetical protein